ncbi:MAG: class I SAM-dependent methyltransferase [Alphaproteobacteria bacterium]|nr:class I SAM-dependent methyltransferase [Alphaproteobacteria bacterium]
MNLALSHPEHGYYIKKDPLGKAGDFTTAPEISQIFGEMIGAFLAQQWRIMGEPATTLMELGPGRGTLMSDMLRITRHVEGFHNSLSINMVETSPYLRAAQQGKLYGQHPDISWLETIELPPKPLLLVANEFFDALPIRQFVSQGKEISERMIALRDGKFIFSPENAPVIREHCPAALDITRKISAHIAAHGGVALFIDYGYIGGSRADTLQALKNHEYHDPLEDVGDADLTAHVDFNALKDAAKAGGATVHGVISQGMFLSRLGAPVRAKMLCKNASDEQQKTILSALSRLIEPEQMGDLFKMICLTGARHPKPEGF